MVNASICFCFYHTFYFLNFCSTKCLLQKSKEWKYNSYNNIQIMEVQKVFQDESIVYLKKFSQKSFVVFLFKFNVAKSTLYTKQIGGRKV